MARPSVCVIAPSPTPVAEPFSGGLTAYVWTLCHKLIDRGHEVTLFAPPGSDRGLPFEELETGSLELSATARHDVSMPPEEVMREHHAYLSLMMRLARSPSRFDVIHNHSLHYLPVVMAPFVSTPMITTLHTPPTPWLESAVQAAPCSAMRFVAVSSYTADQWRPLLGTVDVIRNAIDLDRWPAGPGGGDLVWTGRLVPEKAPHLAVIAAGRAGRRIDLAGPIADPAYFRREVEPLLGAGARYLGHLDQTTLSRVVGAASVAVVTPEWDEPYGLVVAEALACGTPVAGFGRGGIPEVVDRSCARLVPAGDVDALAHAILEAEGLSRRRTRRRAELNCSIENMMDEYELLLSEALAA